MRGIRCIPRRTLVVRKRGESRRKALRDNLVKDEDGELVLGQWDAIVSVDQWWTVQNLLDDPARVTNRSGSTVRKHLGRGFTGAESVASQCGLVLAPILGVADPARAFIDAPMALQRTMIDTLMTVTLRRAKQGKKGFDPEFVEIAWK